MVQLVGHGADAYHGRKPHGFAGERRMRGYRRLVRALQIIFLAVALAGGGTLFMSAGFIASDWLKVQALPFERGAVCRADDGAGGGAAFAVGIAVFIRETLSVVRNAL